MEVATPDRRSSLNISRHLRRREWSKRRAEATAGDSDSRYLCRRFPSTEANMRDLSRDLVGHFGCVNAVEFSPDGTTLASGGDDKRLLLWRVHDKTPSPQLLAGQHASNIFCLDFDPTNPSRIYSGGNDWCVMARDVETDPKTGGGPTAVFLHDAPVYGIDASPEGPGGVFATACSDGVIRIFDARDTDKDAALVLAAHTRAEPFHSVQFNPADPRLVVTSNNRQGIALWDVRRPRKIALRYGHESAMSATFNSTGTKILGLRKRLPPVLYDVSSPVKRAEFDAHGYFNSCTMKSCCFAGADDELVVSGSDDFGVYAWRVDAPGKRGICGPDHKIVKRAEVVLKGHRSIVNQVRFSKALGVLASSGVEKMVKLWGRIDQKSEGISSISSQPQREVSINREQYIRLVLDSADDQDNESTGENRSMLAFFDSLIQRESQGDLGISSASSEDLDSDDDITAGRARAVNFDRWSDVESAEAEEGGMVAEAQGESSGSGGEEGEKRLAHGHPSNGVVSRLRRKMKYRWLRDQRPCPRYVARKLRRARAVVAKGAPVEERSFGETLSDAARYVTSSEEEEEEEDVYGPQAPIPGPSVPRELVVSRAAIEQSVKMKQDILSALQQESDDDGNSSADNNNGGGGGASKKCDNESGAEAPPPTKSFKKRSYRCNKSRRRERTASSSSSSDSG